MLIEKDVVWAKYFFELIKVIRSRSKDPNTKVGCIIVGDKYQILSTGYNDFPFGVKNTQERWERPAKYDRVVHAEANSISLAARSGTALNNTTMYMQGIPCNECTKLIIQAGIKRIFYDVEEWAKWCSTKYNKEHTDRSLEMLREANVEIIGV